MLAFQPESWTVTHFICNFAQIRWQPVQRYGKIINQIFANFNKPKKQKSILGEYKTYDEL